MNSIVDLSFATSLRQKADEEGGMPQVTYKKILKKVLDKIEDFASNGDTWCKIIIFEKEICVFDSQTDVDDNDDIETYFQIKMPKALDSNNVFNRIIVDLHQLGLLIENKQRKSSSGADLDYYTCNCSSSRFRC